MPASNNEIKAVILIVDDEPRNIQLLGNILSEENYSVEFATSGIGALEWVEKKKFDTILLDVMMPGMDGFTLCRRLKNNPSTHQIPIIFITAKTDSQSLIEGFNAGAVDYVTKPFNKIELLIRVETQLKLDQNQVRLRKAKQDLEFAMSDLSEQNKRLIDTQTQLVQSEKMAALGILVSGVAHEINNPNNYINSGSENLRKRIKDLETFTFQLAGKNMPETIRTAFNERFKPLYDNNKSIIEGSQRIKSIVNDLKTFSHLDEAEQKEVSIVDNLKSTLPIVRANFKKEIDFQTDYEEDPMVSCFPAQLNQVFLNLAVNACQAIVKQKKSSTHQKTGLLKVKTSILEKWLQISFEDNGIGISEEVINNIFDPFYTTKPVGEGTGLGLSISHGIIERHGGKIEVTSTLDKGSIFSVFLPLKTAPF